MAQKIKKIVLFVWLLSGLSLLAALPVSAQIYKYIDQNGVLHFTNIPGGDNLYLEHDNYSIGRYTTDKYDHWIRQAAAEHQVAFPLLKALIKVESNFNPQAISSCGAKGLMQIMPMNYPALGIKNPFNPYQNIMGGASYFRQQLDQFDGQLQLALAAYNAGPHAVRRYQRIPPYPETVNFIKRVMKYYIVYK